MNQVKLVEQVKQVKQVNPLLLLVAVFYPQDMKPPWYKLLVNIVQIFCLPIEISYLSLKIILILESAPSIS